MLAAGLESSRVDGDIKDSADSKESLKGFLEGCSACISGLANVSPEGVSLIWKRFRDVNFERSKAAQDFIGGLHKDLYAFSFPQAAVKKATNLFGEEVGDSRYPVLFSESEVAAIKEAVARYRTVPQL